MVRLDQHAGQLGFRPGNRLEQVVKRFGSALGIDQRRAERAEGIGPDADDRRADREAGFLDGEGKQHAQARASLVFVADHGEAHLAFLEPRHGRRKETRREEDVGFHDAVGQVVEFVLQVVAHLTWIDAQVAARAADGHLGIGADTHLAAVGEAADQAIGIAVHALVVDGLFRHGQAAPFVLFISDRGSAKAKTTMPRARRTVMCRRMASTMVAAAVAMAAPARP